MKLSVRLLWLKPGAPAGRAFKLPGAFELVQEYVTRSARFCAMEIAGQRGKNEFESASKRVWFCDRTPGSRVLSSIQLAEELDKAQSSGAGELNVVIGGPDGFTPGDYEIWRPALRWSFGPLTLPHELAAVVACEQLYRAWMILGKHPYHAGH